MKGLVKSHQGFTLMESLVALLVSSLTCFLLFSTIHLTSLLIKQKHDSVVAFIKLRTQIENQVSKEKVIAVQSQAIITEDVKTHYIYELYRDQIRRKSEQGGHEPLIVGVATFDIVKKEDYCQAIVVLKTGEEYVFTFFAQ